MQADSVYPYIVPKEYLQHQLPRDLAKALGHDVYAVLVKELRGLVGNITADDLVALHLSSDAAYSLALENLEKLLKAGLIKAQKFPQGPAGKPFMVVGGHWDAAAVALLPRFADFARKNLGQDDICLSIPHQGISLVFPNGDTSYLKLVRAFVKEKEGNDRKPITFELYTFEGANLRPLQVS